MKNTVGNERIQGAETDYRAALAHFDDVVRIEQAACPHAAIAECEYEHGAFSDSRPPLRICLDCGLTEEGWGIGYKVLVRDKRFIGHIDRYDLYQLRKGQTILDEDKPR
jgi:hypothetical protein